MLAMDKKQEFAMETDIEGGEKSEGGSLEFHMKQYYYPAATSQCY